MLAGYTYKGPIIHWFNSKDYDFNASGKTTYKYSVFSCYNAVEKHGGYYTDAYVLPANLNTDAYLNNFTTTISENDILYFVKESKFPRVKLNLTAHKRCIKPEKADLIVVPTKIEIITTKFHYYIFTDGKDIFGISDENFNTFFGDGNKLKDNSNISMSFNGDIQVLYHGSLKIINSSTTVLNMFLDGAYTKPFITDNDLDKIVSNVLPDPTLEDLKTIQGLLQSPDSDTIKLGALMAAGYNVNKWLLTFTILLGMNTLGMFSENGGNTVAIKHMRNTLNLTPTRWGGLHYIYNTVKKVNMSYTKEDIDLAQKFVKTIPLLSDFCKRMKSTTDFNKIPFIPDEYKI